MTLSFQTTEFLKCPICNKDHKTPENGFPITLEVEEMLNLQQYLNDDHQAGFILLEKIGDHFECIFSLLIKVRR